MIMPSSLVQHVAHVSRLWAGSLGYAFYIENAIAS